MSASTPPPYRCPTCECASVNPRNLAVFIDGTSNKPGDEHTNVFKLFGQVVKDGSVPEQRPHYLKGIGAYETNNLSLLDRVGKGVYGSFEKAFAWNVEKNVKDAYTWLVERYKEGDRIYLFGFSRGAYQVRRLASMIHEVGLVTEKPDVDSAYGHYLSIDPYNPETRQEAMVFRKNFCWPSVRIHFVGVWDTVSSLGLIQRDVHITSSATVTNACHFRHALALDERRVKFMPEYFAEVNAYRGNIRSPRSAVSDVKEVWFAGSHSDVGGISRRHDQMIHYPEDDEPGPHPHAGNVPLLWIRREAAANGLVFGPEEFDWDPDDVDLGREDTMTLPWKFLEILPIRHQVSFSGTGKYKLRWHLFRPRSAIPDQQIHSSILSGDGYTPRAALRGGVGIPTVPGASDRLWTTELSDEGATIRLLTSLLSDQQKTLGSLEQVLFLLNSRLDSEQTPSIPRPQWSEISIRGRSGPDKFALAVVYDVLSNFSASEELVRDARDALSATLSSPSQPYPTGAFYVLRFSTKNETLRRRFIAHDEVIRALMRALEWTARSPSENLFPLVMDSIHYLINDDDLRDDAIDQLSARSGGTETGETRLSASLQVKAPCQLMASLKMITSFAQYKPLLCRELKPKIFELAETERSPVGPAAVGALVTLNAPVTGDIHISNILGYLGSILPPLDAEVGSTSSPDNIGDLPLVFRVRASGGLDEELLRKIVLAIESRDAHERAGATLTLLKLCRNSMIRDICSQDKVADIFMRQLERKETSLLAAYALKTCLERGMAAPLDFRRAAQPIVAMLNKGWFDDAVGRVEGFEIFRGLMTFGNLRQQVVDLGIVASLVKKLEGGERHEVRMGLICLDILGGENSLELTHIVEESITNLTAPDKKTQRKGVKILSALAQTKAGERAIEPRVIDIVRMLLPSSGSPSRSRSQLFGPAAAVYDLSKNETLREQIRASQEFSTLKRQRRTDTMRSQTQPA